MKEFLKKFQKHGAKDLPSLEEALTNAAALNRQGGSSWSEILHLVRTQGLNLFTGEEETPTPNSKKIATINPIQVSVPAGYSVQNLSLTISAELACEKCAAIQRTKINFRQFMQIVFSDQSSNFPESLFPLFEPLNEESIGLIISLIQLREDNIPISQIIAVPDLKNLLSETGMIALKNGLCPLPEAQKCQNLEILNTKKIPNGHEALRRNLISLHEAAQLSEIKYDPNCQRENALSHLLGYAIKALEQKIITPEEAITFYLCDKKPRHKIFCIFLAQKTNENNASFRYLFEQGYITVSDFMQGGAYYTQRQSGWPNWGRKTPIDTLLKELKAAQSPNQTKEKSLAHSSAASVIQRNWRAYQVFKDIRSAMQAGHVEDLPHLMQARTHAMHYRFFDAKKQLELTKAAQEKAQTMGTGM